MLTSIIIPTVLNDAALRRVRALVECNTPEPHELIVVDTTPEARGYVWTANQGLSRAQGEVLVVMNDDCQPQPGWLEPLLGAMQEGVWLCSPQWKYARLGGHCLCFSRSVYEITGGFDPRYRHYCADHHLELILIGLDKPIRQVPESMVIHDPADPLRMHQRFSAKLEGWEGLPNVGAWYNEDQAVYETIWGERRHHQYWPEDWSQVA